MRLSLEKNKRKVWKLNGKGLWGRSRRDLEEQEPGKEETPKRGRGAGKGGQFCNSELQRGGN